MKTSVFHNVAKCCGAKTEVIDSRENKRGIRRRRLCHICGARTTTLEVFVKDGDILLSANDFAMLNALDDRRIQFARTIIRGLLNEKGQSSQ